MRVRKKLAELLTAEMGHEVSPSDLRPQEGRWRSDTRLDVCRWEGVLPGGYGGGRVSAFSWHTMTELIQLGVSVWWDRPCLEVTPLDHSRADERAIFQWQREAARLQRRGAPPPAPPHVTFGAARAVSDEEAAAAQF